MHGDAVVSQDHDGDGKEHLVSGNRCHSGDFQVLCLCKCQHIFSRNHNKDRSTMRLFLWLQFSIKERKMVPNMLNGFKDKL